MTMILINTINGEPVSTGSLLTDFRGDHAILVSATPPHKPSSTGRVYVRSANPGENWTAEYYPSVYDLKWVREEV